MPAQARLARRKLLRIRIAPRIGLVLSGGGARGAAHIGVLKVLDELRVPIDAIAGTSMGAVVGGLYASGLSAREIESIMSSLDWQDAFRDRPPRTDLTFRRKQEDQNFLVKFPLGLRCGQVPAAQGADPGAEAEPGAAPADAAGSAHSQTSTICRCRSAPWPPISRPARRW